MQSHLADVWFRVTDLDVVSGSGCWVTTATGERYLDFTSGIAVTSTGHCHPKVVAAIQEQATKFIHAQVNVYRHPLLEQLGARLNDITPDSIDTFYFSNSGAEATEGGVKLARQVTGRPNLIVFSGSFHGRTAQTMAMTTSKTGYRAGHSPLPSGVFVTPFPYSHRMGVDDDTASRQCIEALQHLLLSQTAPSETAAIFIEPVLGEGGYVPAPPQFLQALRELCDEHSILLCIDEVQSGFGRTGTMFACEQANVRPDILLMAKGIASGFPISAIGASHELMAKWPIGRHGGTYGGNPLGCAAALATIDVLTEAGFMANVVAQGERLRNGLRQLAQKFPAISDVRGAGLMVASEFGDPERAKKVIAHCASKGKLLLMNAGTYGTSVRWMPPLIVNDAEIDQALTAFGNALAATE